MENIYPNNYILIVAISANRKALPLVVSKRMLTELQITLSKDSGSKRNLTKELAEAAQKEQYLDPERKLWVPQSAMSIISKEMSSLLAVEPKLIIEFLTDGYDSHDAWDYGTSGQGKDLLYNVCINSFIATTPTWFSGNLPQEAIGGGYTSRTVIVYGDKVYKRVPRPVITEEQKKIYKALIKDLSLINKLVGKFSWTTGAEKLFDSWYNKIDQRIKGVSDERLLPFVGRMHVHVLKTAMALRVDHEDSLILTEDEIGLAIDMLEEVLDTASEAFGGLGTSRTALEVHRLAQQIRLLGRTTFRELLQTNLRTTNKTELTEVLETLHAAGEIRMWDNSEGESFIEWDDKRTKELIKKAKEAKK